MCVCVSVFFLINKLHGLDSESNGALLNLAIYAALVFTPTAIMAQLNNLAVVCK